MAKRITILGILIGSFFVGTTVPAYAPQETRLLPCPTEDSVNCYWDARLMGDGHGRSFIVDENGTVTYTD